LHIVSLLALIFLEKRHIVMKINISSTSELILKMKLENGTFVSSAQSLQMRIYINSDGGRASLPIALPVRALDGTLGRLFAHGRIREPM